jgi:hypothetical protein
MLTNNFACDMLRKMFNVLVSKLLIFRAKDDRSLRLKSKKDEALMGQVKKILGNGDQQLILVARG